MPDRATLDELLDFANKVREAGGGNPIDALMPAVPEDSHQCLIARNLNFNCQVGGEGPADRDDDSWWMTLDSPETRDKIAEALGLESADWDLTSWEYPSDVNQDAIEVHTRKYGVLLPERIAEVAIEFDRWYEALEYYGDGKAMVLSPEATPEAIERLKEFWPFIEESVKEARSLAIVNERGELIL